MTHCFLLAGPPFLKANSPVTCRILSDTKEWEEKYSPASREPGMILSARSFDDMFFDRTVGGILIGRVPNGQPPVLKDSTGIKITSFEKIIDSQGVFTKVELTLTDNNGKTASFQVAPDIFHAAVAVAISRDGVLYTMRDQTEGIKPHGVLRNHKLVWPLAQVDLYCDFRTNEDRKLQRDRSEAVNTQLNRSFAWLPAVVESRWELNLDSVTNGNFRFIDRPVADKPTDIEYLKVNEAKCVINISSAISKVFGIANEDANMKVIEDLIQTHRVFDSFIRGYLDFEFNITSQDETKWNELFEECFEKYNAGKEKIPMDYNDGDFIEQVISKIRVSVKNQADRGNSEAKKVHDESRWYGIF